MALQNLLSILSAGSLNHLSLKPLELFPLNTSKILKCQLKNIRFW